MKKKAFTLFELIIAVLILAIIATKLKLESYDSEDKINALSLEIEEKNNISNQLEELKKSNIDLNSKIEEQAKNILKAKEESISYQKQISDLKAEILKLEVYKNKADSAKKKAAETRKKKKESLQ